jgi:hypothetical protein
MKKLVLSITFLFIFVVACKSVMANKNELNLIFESKSESSVTGNANFTEKNGIVTLTAKMSGYRLANMPFIFMKNLIAHRQTAVRLADIGIQLLKNTENGAKPNVIKEILETLLPMPREMEL